MTVEAQETVARRLGMILNPFALFTAFFAAVALAASTSLLGAFLYVAMELIAAGSVVAFLLRRTAAKKASDFWLKVRSERRVPALVLLAAALSLQVALLLSGAPRELVFLMGSMLVAALVLALVTLAWKASAHSAVAGHAAVWGVVVLGPWGLPFVAAAPAVMWARAAEHRHTPAQVVVGAGVGALVAALGAWAA